MAGHHPTAAIRLSNILLVPVLSASLPPLPLAGAFRALASPPCSVLSHGAGRGGGIGVMKVPLPRHRGSSLGWGWGGVSVVQLQGLTPEQVWRVEPHASLCPSWDLAGSLTPGAAKGGL
ncbi:unnamed protein product [Natator depressus]